MSDLFLLGTAYVDLEVHLSFAQRLGVGDHPTPAFEGEDVADLQYVAHVVRRHAWAILEVDAVAIVADHRLDFYTRGASSTRLDGVSDPDHDRHPGREPGGDRIPRDAGASYGLLGRVGHVAFRLFRDNQRPLDSGQGDESAPARGR
jgi:hypothetical protein